MKAPLGTTFIVAAGLLGVAAVAQLIAVLVYFGPGLRQTPPPAPVVTEIPVVVAPLPAQTPEPTEHKEPGNEDVAPQARVEELIAEADKLEGGTSPADALKPLEEALAVQPTDAVLLSRVAALHERLGQTDEAIAAWKKLVALGPAAGNLFQVADVRLKLLENPESPEGGLEIRDQTGLQPGSSLGIVDLKISDSGETSAPIKDLRLAVKARPGEVIDARDVRINVTFYEMLNGEIVPTMSRVQSMWFTPPVDWKNDGLEILEVKYEVPRLGPGGGPPPDYYGYMVNIYHHGQLQETRADPVDLQELFPPSLNEAPAAQGNTGRAR